MVFVSDLPLPPDLRFGPSLHVDVEARPNLLGSCNPVRVEVTVDTSNMTLGPPQVQVQGGSRFALAVFGRIEDPTVTAHPPESDVRIERVFQATSPIRARFPRFTVITGTVRQWPVPPYFLPLTFRFKANWASRRAGGSCFVVLPALVGTGDVTNLAVEASEQARIPYRRAAGSQSALSAATDIREDGVTVSRQSGDTRPPPTDQSIARWECEIDRRESYVRRGEIADYDPTLVTPRNRRDCAARAVLTTTTLQEWGAFIGFALAAIAALGLQMLYDGLTIQRRSRRRQRS